MKNVFELYPKIHRPIAVNSCQIELARKDILLSDAAVLLYKAGSCTDAEDI